MRINNIEFMLTCYSHPEQYDLFADGERQVGYVRIRHGKITVECPDVGGSLVMSRFINGDGYLLHGEREQVLQEAANAVSNFYYTKQ